MAKLSLFSSFLMLLFNLVLLLKINQLSTQINTQFRIQYKYKKMSSPQSCQTLSLTSSTKFKKSMQSSKLTQASKEVPANNIGSAIMMNPQTYAINTRLSNILLSLNILLENGNVQQAIPKLLQLKQKLQFMRKNGKQFDPKIQLICCYNISCGYQVMAFQKTTQTALQDCIVHLKNGLHIMKALTQQSNKQQIYLTYKLKLKLLHVKMLMQYCALLSQVESHQLALQIAKEALTMLIDIFCYGLTLCNQKLKQIGMMKQKTKKIDDSLAFIQGLIESSKGYLNQLINLDKFDSIKSENMKSYQKIKQNSYFWKDNFQNNCKIFKKQMKNQSKDVVSKFSYFQSQMSSTETKTHDNKHTNNTSSTPNLFRNSLGIRINSSWMKQLNIGKIMHMTPINYMTLIQPDNIVHQFSYKNIIEKVAWVSIVYFSIATQMRFIQGHKIPQKKNKGPQQNPPIKKSQLYHFKAIQLTCKYIKQECPLVDHLINSYFRHYHSSLATIEEQPSLVEQSSILLQMPKKNNAKVQAKILPDQQDYLLNKVKGKKQIQIKCQWHVISYKNQKSLSDSGQFQSDILIQSQKIYKNGQKQLSSSLKLQKIEKSLSGSNLQTMKMNIKQMASTKSKNFKDHKQHEQKKSGIKKSKSKSNKSISKKSLSKIVGQR